MARRFAMARQRTLRLVLRKRALYLMMIPGIAFLFAFNYMPMYGAIIAFKDFQVKKGILGSPWADPFYKYFLQFFQSPYCLRVLSNTLIISLAKLVITMPCAVLFAVALSEAPSVRFRRAVQTVTYLPHFLSWIIVYGVVFAMLSESRGLINQAIKGVTGSTVNFIKAAFAQGESDSGRDLMKMAIRHRFEKGIPSPRTRTTYGFRPAKDGGIVVDEKCADTVRMIYDLAEQGVWYSKIRAKLNKIGIPSPTGTLWNDGQIADMLHNVMYKGDLLLQKSYKNENRQTCRNEGQVQSWYVHDDHEAIISSEQWERVQQILAARSAGIAEAKERRKAASAHHEHVGRYPLTGLLYCPHCGAVLHHKWCNNGRDEYWVCSTNIKKRASSCKGIFLPSSIADSWNIEAPVVVQRFKDENGMVQFTAYPKDEYEAMKGE